MKTILKRGLMLMVAGCLVARVGAADASPGEVVFQDDFTGMKVGLVSAGVIGAEVEYHYFPQTAPQGNWEVACFRSEASQRAWRVVRENGFGAKQMYQSSTASRADSAVYTHPMLVAGDVLWGDYTLSVEFAPESKENWSGAIVRYRNSRCLYFFGVKQDKAYLWLLNQGTGFRKSTLTILAEKPCSYQPGAVLSAVVEVKGGHIRGELPNGLVLEANDSTFTRGRIGLLADVPTRFQRVTVTMSAKSKADAEKEIAQRREEERRRQAANPKMVVWKKISTSGFGTGRSVRFGDLDGDGKLDVLLVQVNNHGPKDRNSEVGCLTAMTFDGKVLWRSGEPDPWRDRLTSDVACQIHDIDHTGKNDVIYCRDFELVIADGATGKVKRKIQTPLSPRKPGAKGEPINKYERILGDALYFLDLRGTGWPSDIILKDRYSHIYAYNNKLEPLWDVACNTGHYGWACDVDGDGKDEFAIGYSLINHDGKVLWSLDDKLQDHADALAVLKLNPTDREPVLFCAASDEGAFWTDLRGQMLKHLYLGHVQSPSIANYRDDLPGLETVTVNFHGNQGIINCYDARMNVYHDFEPMHHGSMMLPLNWTGRSEEYFVVSPNVDEGAYDGWGRQVLKFPADGHPDMCYDVLDLTGDCRDEIVVWDPEEMWVYTQDDNPKPGRLYKPRRNPPYNRSNYQATVSLPGWSE